MHKSVTYLLSKSGRWLLGLLISLILLSVFFGFQKYDPQFLSLEMKWLIVASIPLIVAILTSDFLQKFKGFGVELETKLYEPMGQISLVAMDALLDLPVDEKGPVNYLDSLEHSKKVSIQRLALTKGRRYHYEVDDISTYLQKLPALKYFEIRNTRGKFIALLPVSPFKSGNNGNHQKLSRLIHALMDDSLEDEFASQVISETINTKENLLDVLSKVRDTPHQLLPVVSDKGQLLGIVTTSIIEKRIADAVITAHKANKQ